jgi:hypothetical protein
MRLAERHTWVGKDPARRPAGAEDVGRRLASIVASNPGDDLTVPLGVADELTSTRRYPTVATFQSPQLPLLQVSREQIRTRGIDTIRAVSSAVRKWAGRLTPRRRWVLGIALAAAFVIVVVSLVTNNGTPPVSPAPAITIPPPAPGSSPLPAPLVRSLDNLAQAVNS